MRALGFQGPLPGEVFIKREAVSLTRLLEGQQALGYSDDNNFFVVREPPLVRCRREISECDTLTVRADEVRYSCPVILIRHEHPPSVDAMRRRTEAINCDDRYSLSGSTQQKVTFAVEGGLATARGINHPAMRIPKLSACTPLHVG